SRISGSLDIDGLEIIAAIGGEPSSSVPLGRVLISIDGSAAEGRFSSASDLAALPTRIHVTTIGPSLLDFSLTDPLEVLGFVRRFVQFLDQFRDSSIFEVAIPFTDGTTLGDLFDFSEAFVNKVYRWLVSN